jgi:hypothetical protein
MDRNPAERSWGRVYRRAATLYETTARSSPAVLHMAPTMIPLRQPERTIHTTE